MGDDKDPSASSASETAASGVVAPLPSGATAVPRPVSVVPRPFGSAVPTSRMPPPPSSRGILPGSVPPGPLRSPPPPPLRNPTPAVPPSPAPAAPSGVVTSAPPRPPEPSGPVTSAAPLAPAASVAASPSVMPRAPATPPPPPQRYSAPPSFSRPLTQPPGGSATAQLEQRLGATQVELRKLGSERHTLRSRLRREADRRHELESALRAEKELRRQASDEHYAALGGLRTRLSEVEAERDAARLELEQARAAAEQARAELERGRQQAERARAELEQARAELEQSRARPAVAANGAAPAATKAGKAVQGLRRIRGIGPAYQRVLEQLGIERVQQVAAWTDADILAFADKLKIRPDRITKDDWVGQAKALEPDPVD